MQDAKPASNANIRYDDDGDVIGLELPMVVGADGDMWIPGSGSIPAKIMVVYDYPYVEDRQNRRVWSGPACHFVGEMLLSVGITPKDVYVTTLVKFGRRMGKDTGNKPTARNIRLCAKLLDAEMAEIKPTVVIAFGTATASEIAGTEILAGEMAGELLDSTRYPGIKVLVMPTPAYCLFQERSRSVHARMLGVAKEFLSGDAGVGTGKCVCDYSVVDTIEQLRAVVALILAMPDTVIGLDCEWEGDNEFSEGAYMRTVQLSVMSKGVIEATLVLQVRDSTGESVLEKDPAMWIELRKLLCSKGVRICGHNIQSDGLRLLPYGVDIGENIFYDTMVAEHVLDTQAMFGLDDLAIKYTDKGRYARELQDFKAKHSSMTANGYGRIPDTILHPYGAMDASVQLEIMKAQCSLPAIQPFFIGQGHSKQYPSLLETAISTHKMCMEMSHNGMLVDRVQLQKLTTIYHWKLDRLKAGLSEEAYKLGMPDFNPNSTKQKQKLLFDVLDLTPVKTTKAHGGKNWISAICEASPEEQYDILPATDRQTLDILLDAHPIIGLLRDYNSISKACSQWLPMPDATGAYTSGVPACIRSDGCLHAGFSQLLDTARLSSKNPNIQNWPKRSDGAMARIFKDDLPYISEVFGREMTALPKLRSIIVSRPGHVILSADFTQAELFILAGTSGDRAMKALLRTPGLDMHDDIAFSGFGVREVDVDGTAITADMRNAYFIAHGEKAFEKWQKTACRYITTQGEVLTRGQFKDGMRVSGKSVNFGIPYGRSAPAIAMQVKAETGSKKSHAELTGEIAAVVNAWKTEKFPDAWAYMVECADNAVNNLKVENCWGRVFHFSKAKTNEAIARVRRVAQNRPIQSGVADTMALACYKVREEREKRGWTSWLKIVNQVHDDLMLEVPESKQEEAAALQSECMSGIQIPLPDGTNMSLSASSDAIHRWGD